MRLRSLIREITTKLHLYKPLYCVYSMLLQREKCKQFDREFTCLLDEINNAPVSYPSHADTVLFTGIFYEEKKPTIRRFFSEIEECLEDAAFIYLDEQKKPEKAEDCWAHHYMPRAIRASGYDFFISYPLTKEMKRTLHENADVRRAAELLYLRQSKDMTRSYACALACWYNRVYRTIIDHYQPKAAVIWCKFPALHTLFDSICKEKGVIPLYMEYGSLPGTFALERCGQMGESRIATDYRTFRERPTTQDEEEAADNVLKYLRESHLNRNVQTQSNDEIDQVKKRMNPQWPTVLFAGNNDFDSGFLPYDAHAQTFHSPLFENSTAAVAQLAALAETMHFNLIYKPHPAMSDRVSSEHLPIHVILAIDVDINRIIDLSDTVVTISSQVGYISCIRQKAVLTLGYNQLRGKGATYEAYSLELIPQQLMRSLQEGFTKEMKVHFLRHVAQLLCYELFDDLTPRPIRYGQLTKQAAQRIKHCIDSGSPKCLEKRLV